MLGLDVAERILAYGAKCGNKFTDFEDGIHEDG
jgi:hypothetical protein